MDIKGLRNVQKFVKMIIALKNKVMNIVVMDYNHNHGKDGKFSSSFSATGANAPCTGFASERKEKEHFKHHGAEFGFETKQEYIKAAIDFLQKPCEGDIVGFMRKSDGAIVRFDDANGVLGIGFPGGDLLTYFKPKFDDSNGVPRVEKAREYYANSVLGKESISAGEPATKGGETGGEEDA